MRRLIVALSLALASALAHAQNPSPVDWATVSRFMSLMQVFMQAAAASSDNDPRAVERTMNEVLAGRNPEANRLMLEIFGDIPFDERERLISIGRSMLVLGQKQLAAASQSANETAVLAARRNLHAMGLSYYDKGQFLEAVKRGDVPAVKLFLAGRAVSPAVTDAWGNSALDHARRTGNPELLALFEAAARRP
jgi:hypothetical protein